MTFYSYKIAYDEHLFTNRFLCLAEIQLREQLYFINHTNIPLCQKSLDTLHSIVLNVIDYYDILFINDAHDEHQCTNQFHYIAEIYCNKNCISLIITMLHHVRNHFKHYIPWF